MEMLELLVRIRDHVGHDVFEDALAMLYSEISPPTPAPPPRPAEAGTLDNVHPTCLSDHGSPPDRSRPRDDVDILWELDGRDDDYNR